METTYHIYKANGDKIFEFKSMWQFSIGEKIFLQRVNGGKRNLLIMKITHDVLAESDKHIVRLYVEEGKIY